MKAFLHHKWIKIVAAALSLSLIAAALEVLFWETSGPFRGGAETVTRPFLRLWAEGAERVASWEVALTEGEALLAENKALRQENTRLQRRLHTAQLARKENARLRVLLEVETEEWKGRFLPAWILPSAGDSLSAEVTLDHGTADGVRPGLCVTDCAGNLLGLVRTVGADCCTVSLLWDGRFRLTGQGVRSETVGVLEGDLSLLEARKLKLTGLTEEEMVDTGETVVTLGGNGDIPQGLAVGTVTGLRDDPGGLTRWAVITPTAKQTTGEVFIALPERGARP